MSGMGFDIKSIGAVQSLLQNPDNLAALLQQGNDKTGESPAEVFADVVNMIRVDQKRIAQEVGVDVEIHRMTPQGAGELLAGTVNGKGVAIVEMFNEEADRRERILREMIGDEEYEHFEKRKHAMLYTSPEE